MRRILIIAGLIIAGITHATPNMPLSCTVSTAPCPSDKSIYAPGAAGVLVLNPINQWKLWESFAPTDIVRVCPSDIEAGSTKCPVARASLAKSLAAAVTPAPRPIIWRATHTWLAPLTDVDGVPLAAGDITGYLLSWRYASTAEFTEVTLGTVLTYTHEINPARICARVTVLGKSGNSDPTPEYCTDPPVTKVTPGPVSGYQVSFGQ